MNNEEPWVQNWINELNPKLKYKTYEYNGHKVHHPIFGVEALEKRKQELEAINEEREYMQHVHQNPMTPSEAVKSGEGVLGQITKRDTYTGLTKEKLEQTVRDVFYNANSYTGYVDMDLVDEVQAFNDWLIGK